MNSLLAAALGGAIGGALGVPLGALIGRMFPEKWRNPIRTIVSVALVIIGWRVAVALLAPPTPPITPAAVEAQLLEHPEMGGPARAWRDADPASYSTFAARMVANVQAGVPEETVVNNARTEMMAVAVPRLLFLEDAQMLDSARISVEYLNDLRSRQPSTCRPFFIGEPFGDLTPYVGADALRRERLLLEAAFRADTSTPKPTMTGAALQTTLAQVLAITRERVGDDVLMLTNEASSAGRDVQYCEAASAFLQSVLTLPPAEGAAFLRGLRAVG